MSKQKLLPLSKEDRKFAYEFLSDTESYHSHKETSAYTIFAAEVAFFTALLTTDWYGKIESKILHPKLLVCFSIFFIWLFIHRFMRWQLINRRIAALQFGTLTTALLNYLKMKDELEVNTSTSDEETTEKNDAGIWINNILDKWLWPRYSAKLESDIPLEDYPDWYRQSYVAFQKKGTGAIKGEKFPTIGSIFILIISILHVIFIRG